MRVRVRVRVREVEVLEVLEVLEVSSDHGSWSESYELILIFDIDI